MSDSMHYSKVDFIKNISLLKKLRQFEEALALCNHAIELYIDDYEFFEFRSEIFRNTNNFDKAFSDLEHVIQLKPDEIAPFFRRGRWSFEAGNYSHTIQDMSKIIDSDNSYFRDAAFYYRSQSFLLSGDIINAIADCEKIPDDFTFPGEGLLKNELFLKINSFK